MLHLDRHALMDLLRGHGKRCSVSELASSLGRTRQQIGRYLSGFSDPPDPVIVAMAERLGVSVESITLTHSGGQTDEEQKLLSLYRDCDPVGRARVLAMAWECVQERMRNNRVG